MELQQIERKLISAKTNYQSCLKQIERRREQLVDNKRRSKNLEEALLILQQVGMKTQQELEFQISEIVSLALSSVFDDPYEFKIEFVPRRGKTEADLYFLRDGEKYFPLDDNGGGTVDVASFALRVALWNLSRPKTRNVLILDEPFKFLSSEHLSRASEMLKMISERLKIQIIMVTHIPELIDSADKVFTVTKNKKGISQIK